MGCTNDTRKLVLEREEKGREKRKTRTANWAVPSRTEAQRKIAQVTMRKGQGTAGVKGV